MNIPSLAKQVGVIEKRTDVLNDLVGEILATLELNRLNRTIAFLHQPHGEVFDRLLLQWKKRHDAAWEEKT